MEGGTWVLAQLQCTSRFILLRQVPSIMNYRSMYAVFRLLRWNSVSKESNRLMFIIILETMLLSLSR